MTPIDRAITDLVAWADRGAAWPASAGGLLDIVSTGFADAGIHEPSTDPTHTGAIVAALYRGAARLLATRAGTSARRRLAHEIAVANARYHCEALQTLLRTSGFELAAIESGLDGPHSPAIRRSFAELLAHLAIAFGRHGRVPHCGPAGRTLLPGAVAHEGPEPFRPDRPFYRYAGDGMAEVHTHFGAPIFVDTRDDSVSPELVRTGWWEAWIDGIVQKSVGRGDVVVNVGANLGYYALRMAHLVESTGRVYAFEPNPRLVRLMRRSLTWGGLLGMTTLLPVAVSDSQGEADFVADDTYLGGGNLFRFTAAGAGRFAEVIRGVLEERHPHFGESEIAALLRLELPEQSSFRVAVTTLDATIGRAHPEIAFLLIDVEGAELAVLDGARDLILRSGDIAMIVEWSSGVTFAPLPEERAKARAVIDWLVADGFRFWRISGDPSDIYARPAILSPIAPEAVIAMTDYCDLFICRQKEPRTP